LSSNIQNPHVYNTVLNLTFLNVKFVVADGERWDDEW
jgi:hypothetical protein